MYSLYILINNEQQCVKNNIDEYLVLQDHFLHILQFIVLQTQYQSENSSEILLENYI